MAQDYRFSGFDAPRGATATVNLRVPLGTSRQQADRRMSYGLTLGYGQTVGAPTLDGRTATRSVNLADLRFNNSGELRNARVVDTEHLSTDQVSIGAHVTLKDVKSKATREYSFSFKEVATGVPPVKSRARCACHLTETIDYPRDRALLFFSQFCIHRQ